MKRIYCTGLALAVAFWMTSGKLEQQSREIHHQIVQLEQEIAAAENVCGLLESKLQETRQKVQKLEANLFIQKENSTRQTRLLQQGELSFWQQATLEQTSQQLEDEIQQLEELQSYQQQLQVSLESFRINVKRKKRGVAFLRNRQVFLAARFDGPHLKEGGSPEQEAMISQDQRLPVYQTQERKEEAPKTDLTANFVLEDLEKSSVGGVRNGIDFDKACPADLDGAELDLHFESMDWMVPVEGYVSAGTWAYPGGGMHLGLDIASSMFTPVKAPAAGIIVYANNPVDSNNGYLGNYCGWPYGGGNTICMLCQVQDRCYAVSFNHLSNQILVTPGQQVQASAIIALSGNSGNSSGPHTHIEVFALHVTMEEAVAYFRQGADFAFGCGWNTPAACSTIGCRIRPELLFF